MKEQIEAALKRRVPDAEFSRKLTEHFNAQNDLFTTCQRCRQQISGSRDVIELHVLMCGTTNG